MKEVMTIKTSWYYSNRIRKPGLRLIGISNAIPQGLSLNVRLYPALRPGWKLVHELKSGYITEDKYTEMYYYLILNRLNPTWAYEELGENAVLLCFEKPGEFCHRRIIAEWFNEHLRVKVNEL